MKRRLLLWKCLGGLLVGLLTAGVLAATALAYRNPSTLTQLADQLWSCF